MLAILAFAGGLWAVAGPTLAQDRVINPFVDAYGADLDVDEIDLRVGDNLLPGHQDRAARTYIERAMPAEQRDLFRARHPDLPEAQAAERMAEFLAVANLQDRFEDNQTAGRKVRLVVRVDEARADSMLRMAMAPRFPRTAMAVSIQDLATGRTLVTGRIEDVASYAADNAEARDRLGLVYSRLGTDTDFQILAGMTNALAASLETLLRAESTAVGSRSIARAVISPTVSVPIRISRAMYELNVAPPETAQGED
ncbi:hypothetical protein [Brevundimonas sp.]|uniref:hypothetical protein n=1 Tax=Brevundimonas sp. TaxID=1871086 RepID=UPI002CD8F46C|nr:hypothetical protein [Brevundimonas sp.]HWQ88055.1 hypothetical protein [Brevundimonas sp.]